MVLKCFPGVLTRCKQMVARLNQCYMVTKTRCDVTLMLPDDVLLFEILSRCQADQVLACARVCVRWHALTSSPEFVEAQLKTATPTIFLHHIYINKDETYTMDLYTVDDTGKSIVLKRIDTEHIIMEDSVDHSSSQLYVYTSCNGLLLFLNPLTIPGQYVIRNFVTGKRILVRERWKLASPCAIFFSHSMKKYNSLHVTYHSDNSYFYHIFTSEDNLWRELGSFPYTPLLEKGPIAVNGILYWKAHIRTFDNEHHDSPCSESIMFFDTNKETFGVRPHPEPCCAPTMITSSLNRSKHTYMNLLDIEGSLAFCSVHKTLMHVWHLEDCQGWSWIKRYEVELGWGLTRSDLSHFTDIRHCGDQIIPMNIKSNELLIWWSDKGLYQYDLRLNTVRRVKSPLVVNGHITYTKSVNSIVPIPALM